MLKQKDLWILALAALISGGGWILLPSQISVIPKEFSIAYRFLLTSLVLGTIAHIRGERIFDKGIIKLIVFQGMIMYPLTYFLTYSACHHIPSGLVGLISSMIVIPTYMIGLAVKEYKFSSDMLATIAFSCLGLGLIFHKDLILPTNNLLGLSLAILSAFTSALGYALIRNISQQTTLSTLSIAVLSTGVGGISSLIYAVVKNGDIVFSTETNFLVSLFLLGVILTPFVFVSLYHLAAKFSTLHTSYVFATAPVFSVALSTAFEGYTPDILNLFGVCIVISSCLLAHKKVTLLKKVQEETSL